LAQEYKDKLSTNTASYDYPVLFWLSQIFNQSSNKLTVFDFGGNVGNHFYSYSTILKYPDGLNWTVCDLPEITKAGQKLAQDLNSSLSLSFTTEFIEANGKNIFIASGSLQYVDSPSVSLSLLLRKTP
jgi:putative methyltransferase (TIGR04325 family)